jgi:hypothetical protein
MTLRMWLIGGVAITAMVVGVCVMVPQFLAANPDDAPELRSVVQANGVFFSDPAPAVPAAPVARPRPKTPTDDFNPRFEVTPARPTNDITPGHFPEFAPPPHVPPQRDNSFDLFAAPVTNAVAAPPPVEPPVDAATVDPAPLRRELLDLLHEKVELLSVPQLQGALISTEREIRELKATDRLEQLRHELDRLSRDYPQTWGGESARRLYHVPLPPTGPTPTTPLNPFADPPAPTLESTPPFSPVSPRREQLRG